MSSLQILIKNVKTYLKIKMCFGENMINLVFKLKKEKEVNGLAIGTSLLILNPEDTRGKLFFYKH